MVSVDLHLDLLVICYLKSNHFNEDDKIVLGMDTFPGKYFFQCLVKTLHYHDCKYRKSNKRQVKVFIQKCYFTRYGASMTKTSMSEFNCFMLEYIRDIFLREVSFQTRLKKLKIVEAIETARLSIGLNHEDISDDRFCKWVTRYREDYDIPKKFSKKTLQNLS